MRSSFFVQFDKMPHSPSSLRFLLRFAISCAVVVTLVAALPAQTNRESKDLGQRVRVYPLSPHVWVAEFLAEFGSFGTVTSNAVIVMGTRSSILLDTPADDAQTKVLLDWAANTLHKPVEKLIVTHAHRDRLGGIRESNRRGIASYALPRTRTLAKQRGYGIPKHPLKSIDTVSIDGATVETFFPGHGHTEDNIVVWYAPERVLHGGCFVKDATATNLGNLEEINPGMWKPGVEKVKARYPQPAVTIPGHGEPGNGLLEQTSKLIAEHAAKH